MADINLKFLNGNSLTLASRLLGCNIEREIDGQVLRVRIVETEAYDQTDTASHSYKGRSPKNEVMFGPSGHLYVYFTYGMHYCCNIVVGPKDYGAAVLIRAVEPISGQQLMAKKRIVNKPTELTNGPAKLCQALSIDSKLNGHDLTKSPLRLIPKPAIKKADITITTRVGISKARDLLRRFYISDSPYVSKR